MSSLPDALKDLRAALKPQMPEDEVEHLLSPLYILLGYQQTGKDIRRKRKGRSGIPDVLLLNSDESVQAVVEVKRPSEDVSDHLEQVKKYMLELRSPFGILTNGSWWVFYRLDGKNVRILERYTTENLERDPSPFEVLRKQTLELTDFVAVKARLENQEGLVLRQLGELPTEQFLQSFGLEASSPFCELVEATYGLLGQLEGKSKFVSGSFDFWSKIYAREVGVDEVPKLWRDSGIPLPATVDGLKRFSFVLETAYTLAARLILAKAIEDHDSAGNIVADPLGKRLLNQLSAKKVGRGATIPLEAYPQAVETLFNDYALQLFTSIYATDIFDWWRDYALHPDPAGEKFARALARVLLSLLRFNFSELQGDLLGELYQSYFDPETRKALGEFYTPPAVVNFILDEVGYSGDRQSRLLDPATGSGTFIVQALRRYLKENASADPVKTLEGITQEYRLVAFDVNPFAVLMAQINFAAELVPLYTRAIVQDKNFTLRRLPIVRTDSLRQEPIEGELLRDKAQVGLNFEGDTIKPRIQLPVKLENGTFKTVELELPQYHYARGQSGWGIVNEAGWLSALQAIFAAVEATSQAFDRDSSIKFDLPAALHLELSKRFSSPDKLQSGLEQYVSKLWDTLRDLKQNHGDGRFLKTLEDLTLGLILKHYLKYDYVVGNPPYVKTQNLPEDSRRYWEGLYKWAHGNFDIYVPFLERALATDHPWLNEGGVVGYILPNRFLNANYTEQLRLELPACASVRSITDFTAVTFQPPTETQASKLFREAMVYPAILIAEKKGAEEAGTDSSDPLTVTRFYPRPARIAPETALREVRGAYATLRDGKTPDALEHAQTFTQSQAVLQGKGWYLMPELEQKVFDKLEAVGKQYDPELGKPQQDEAGANLKLERRLKNYTATSSGGFAGIQTSADHIMILEQLDENLGKGLLLVRPKGGHVEPFWAEKAALRKFLFGKDVGRWAINWEKWWVIFPYVQLEGVYKLMPSSQYRHWQFVKKANVFEPFAQYPADAPLIDQVYPKLWAYLLSQEKELRKREGSRFVQKKIEEFRWYDLMYPRSLEHATSNTQRPPARSRWVEAND